MSKVYRIHGARFLRKYTAAEKSSNYAYMADVRKIADTLCKVPWTRVSGDVAATTTIHTEEGLDWNEPERDRFDAAEWCGEHADGFHRAFAQAACYVFKLPASAVGKAIEKIRVNVTSDPYNPYGARIAAMTSATLEIPMDCQTVREGEVFRAPDEDGMGAAPRLFRTNQDGSQTWYANSEIVELEPGSTLTAKQYLFVFVALENYNRGRDGWIEGSSYIDNDVELTLSAAASDFVEDEINDCSQVVAPVEYPVVLDGVIPDVQGFQSGVVSATVTAAGTSPLMNGTVVENIEQIVDELSPANIYGGIRSLYGKFETGDLVSGDFYSCCPNRKRIGVGFSVKKGTGVVFADANGVTSRPPTIVLTASSMFVPFAIPDNKPNKVEFDWSDWLSGRSPTNGTRFVFYVKPGTYLTEYDVAVLKNPEMYRGSGDVGGWNLLGTADVSSGGATFAVDFGSSTVGTILMAAYLPQDGISNTSAGFDLGTGGVFYNSISPDSVLGVGAVVDFSTSTTYHNGDYVRMNYNTSLLTFSRKSVSANRVSFAGGKWVAGTSTGIKVSDDGRTYRDTNVYASANIEVCYHDGRYVAVKLGTGYSCAVVYWSDNGETWNQASVPSGVDYLDGCIFFGGRFMASSGSGAGGILASADGKTWERVKSDSSADICKPFVIGSVAFFGSKYYSADGYAFNATGCSSIGSIVSAFSYGGNCYLFGLQGYAFGSANSLVAHTGMMFMSACTNGSVIIATTIMGGMKRSTNGVDWSDVSGYSGLMGVMYYAGSFFACGYNSIYYSNNGQTWVNVSTAGGDRFCVSEKAIVSCGSGSYVCTDVEFGEIYKCVVASSSSPFSIAQWQKTGVPSPDRLTGIDDLCVPDITLIS